MISPEFLLELRAKIPDLFSQFKRELPELQALGIGRIFHSTQNEFDYVLTFFVSPGGREKVPDIVVTILSGRSVNLSTASAVTGAMEFSMGNCKYERPAKGGTCIAPRSGGLGTLGGVITNKSGEKHVVSCGHVMGDFDSRTRGRGRYIVQPESGDIFAIVTESVEWLLVGMKSDAAVAKVNNNNDVCHEIAGLGTPTGIGEPVIDMRVWKSGTTTGVTCGLIKSVGMTAEITRKVLRRNGSYEELKYEFHDVFFIEKMSGRGDSGSLILDQESIVRGILFAQSEDKKLEQFSIACTIPNTIDALCLQGWSWSP
ncbi:MAG: hypothetical protein SGI88_21790 [Candidatus Hydrogenedentes bacterium]|nr:hypothetical protein [Candidatus Hydrogenedentota bacterium]